MRTAHSTYRPIATAALFTILLSLIPVVAHAEERDPGEIGHAIFILGMIALLFLGSMAFGIWLIVARLRSDAEAAEAKRASSYANLEGIWFPASRAMPERTHRVLVRKD